EGDVSPNAKQRIAFAAEGHPLFLAELASMVLEQHKGAHQEAKQQSPSSLPMPRTVRALVEERLVRLPEAERHTLEVPAVLGREFAAAVLAAGGGAIPADVSGSVSALARRDLLFPASVATRAGPS